MIPSRYWLRKTIEVHATYDQMTHFVRKNLKTYFHKGYIDQDETQVFFGEPVQEEVNLTRMVFVIPIPLIQVTFNNQLTPGQKTKVSFRLVTFAKIFQLLVTTGLSYLFVTLLAKMNEITWEVYVIPILLVLVGYVYLYKLFINHYENFMALMDEELADNKIDHARHSN